MIRSVIALVSASLAAAQTTRGYRAEIVADPNNAAHNTFGAGTYDLHYYIGRGRSAMVKPVPTTLAPTQIDVVGVCASDASIQTRIFYGIGINETDGQNRTDPIDCSEPINGNCWDRPSKPSTDGGIRWCQREDFTSTNNKCRAMTSFLTGNGSSQPFVSLNIRNLATVGTRINWPYDLANINTPMDVQYNAHGDKEYDWWIGYTITVPATCSYRFQLSWVAYPFNPEETHCSAQIDAQFPTEIDQDLPYFANNTDQPRHGAQLFGSSTVTVPGKRTDIQSNTNNQGKLTNIFAASNTHYWELGKGPILELACVDFHVTSNRLPTAGCAHTLAVVPAGVGWSLHLLEVPSCDVFATSGTGSSAECCYNTDEASCLGDRSTLKYNEYGYVESERQAVASCIWVAESGTCYPNQISSTDLRLGGVLTDKGNGYTFQSNKIHGPLSTSVTTDWEAKNGYQGGATSRTWLLRFVNDYVPAAITSAYHEQCDVDVTGSWLSTTSGGICEPGLRQTCEAQTNMCLASDPVEYPRFWNLAADTLEVKNDLYDNYKVCNCLKEKEVCYRNGGCMSTKKYQLILQNCLEAGCGNYCNSVGRVAVSLLTVALMVLAVLL